MRVTFLHHRWAWRNDRVIVDSYFSSRGGGAENWQELADSYEEDAESVGTLFEKPPRRPDGPLSPGRGGRFRARRIHTALTRAIWQQRRAVRKALNTGALAIDDSVVGAKLVDLAAKKFAEILKPIIDENRAEEELEGDDDE